MQRQILDPTVVNDLKYLSDEAHPTFFWDQVKLFGERGRSLVESIEEGIRNNDLERVQKTAHALAGSAAAVGAIDLRDTCLKLEHRASHQPTEGLLRLNRDVAQAFTDAEHDLLAEACQVFIEIERAV